MPNPCEQCPHKSKKRSNRQNKSMFGIPYKLIAERLTELWGETVTTDRVHIICKKMFEEILLAYQINDEAIQFVSKKTGSIKEVGPTASTASVTTVGAMRYYEALQKFGAEYLDIDIPSPNEQDYSRIESNR